MRQYIRMAGFKGLENFGMLSEGIYRGAQPTKGGFETLRSLDIMSIINLRSEHSDGDLQGNFIFKNIVIPMKIEDTPDQRVVTHAVNMLDSLSKSHGVFIHCAHGQDRTGLVCAMYRMTVQGWSWPEAREELQAYGFNDIWFHFMCFLKKYAKTQEGLDG